MARTLRDRLMYESPKVPYWVPPPFGMDGFREGLTSTVSVNIDNVADYFYGPAGKAKWDFDRDFPNLAPPWDGFWMEYARPWHVASYNDVLEWRRKNGIAEDDEEADFGETAIPERVGLAFQPEKNDDGSWAMVIGMFLDAPLHGLVGPLKWILDLDPDGSMLGLGILSKRKDDLEALDIARKHMDLLYPAFLALSFTHCGNVTVDRAEDEAPAVRKAFQKRHGVKKARWHHVYIEPMKKVLASAGVGSGTSLPKALHIVRGHFADYRERGLFGKHHGVYWFDSTVRGSASVGTVDKDYIVKGPREDA